MPRILETKTRYADLARARLLLEAAGGVRRSAVRQQDTYFQVPIGWLKLRIQDARAELVAYRRSPGKSPHACTYAVTTVSDSDACRDGLAAVLGVRAVVRKQRELWALGPTTVHIDDVERLGCFIELETPVDEMGEQAHLHCAALLGIDPDADIAMSYADLVDEP